MACSWCGKTPVTMQRLTDSSYYCGIGCFVSAWRGHAAQHRTGLTQRGPRSDDVNEWANPEAEGEGKTTEQKWIEVADTQSYTPSVDDVGHMLKLACVPYSSDGSKKGIAKTLKTSYVIAPPPSPTPRRMMMVRNNVAVSVGKPGTARTNSSRCVPPCRPLPPGRPVPPPHHRPSHPQATNVPRPCPLTLASPAPLQHRLHHPHVQRTRRDLCHARRLPLLRLMGPAVELPAAQHPPRAALVPFGRHVPAGGSGGSL